jgi:hypothetical protein
MSLWDRLTWNKKAFMSMYQKSDEDSMVEKLSSLARRAHNAEIDELKLKNTIEQKAKILLSSLSSVTYPALFRVVRSSLPFEVELHDAKLAKEKRSTPSSYTG